MTVGVRKLFEKTSGLKEGGSGSGTASSPEEQAAQSHLDRATDDLQDLIDNQQSFNNNDTSDGPGAPGAGHASGASAACGALLTKYEAALTKKDMAAANRYQQHYRECMQNNATKPSEKH